MKFELILPILSMFVLFIVSSILGVMGHTSEMALAIVAGSLGLTFSDIDKFKKFSGAGFTAELREKIEAVIEKETELVEPSDGFTSEAYGLDKDSNNVVLAIKNPKYTWRYPPGLAKDSGVKITEVNKTLDWLLENGLAKTAKGKHGEIWSLTTKGREVFLNLS